MRMDKSMTDGQTAIASDAKGTNLYYFDVTTGG